MQERFDIDYFLIAMPYTLLDQDALNGELQMCLDRGVRVVIGAAFWHALRQEKLIDPEAPVPRTS